MRRAKKRTLAGRSRPISSKKAGGEHAEKGSARDSEDCLWRSHIISSRSRKFVKRLHLSRLIGLFIGEEFVAEGHQQAASLGGESRRSCEV